MSVRETLELDISDALASIEQVGDRLANVAQAFGEVLSDALEAALNGLPIITPEVDATPVSEQVAEALDEATATDRVVGVDADTTEMTADIDAAVDAVGAVVEVTVEADTSQAEEAITALGGAAVPAADGLGQTADAAGALGDASSLAAGGMGGLTARLGSAGPIGAAAAVAVGGLTFGLGELYSRAVDSVQITETFERTLGATGDRILDLRSGTTGFDTDLQSLAQTVGSSDEAVLLATQRFAQWQRSTGAAEEQVVAMSQGVAVLAAQIRANNPAAGEMDEIISALTRSIGRGGPRLRNFGLAFGQLEITKRAEEMFGLKEAYTDAEKAQAGLSLATEQLAPSFNKVSEAAGGTQLTLERAEEKIGDTLETLGTPLVAPVVSVMEELALLFEEVGLLVAPLIGAFANELSRSLRVFTTAVRGVNDMLGRLGDALSPIIGDATDAAGGMNLLSSGLRGVVRGVISSIPVLGPFANLMADLAGLLPDAASASDEYATSVRNTGLAEAVAARITNEFWLSVERTSNELANATAANSLFYASITTLAETAMSNIPQVTDAFRNLGTETNADILTGNLEAQIAATDTWALNMTNLTKLGFDNITALMAELGPTQSAILLEQYRGREGELETHLEEMAAAQQRAAAKINEIALRGYLTLNDITGTEADAIVATFGARLQLGTPTQAEIDAVIASPKRKELEAMAAFGDFAGATTKSVTDIVNEETGKAIAKNLDAGLGAGLSVEQAQAVWRAAIYAQKVKDKINEIFGVKSPSTEMMDTGRNLVLGLAMGIGQNTGLMDGAMNALGQSVLGVNLSAGAPTIRDVTVQVPVTVSAGMTAEDGRAIGQAAGQAAAAEVARMMRMEVLVS